MTGGIGSNHMRHTRHYVIQVDQLTNYVTSFDRVSHVANDIISAAAIVCHVDQDLAKSAGVRLPFVDKAHPRIGVTDDSRKRLVQFMGKRRRHFSEQTNSGE